MEEKIGLIYKATCKINNKIYIGKTFQTLEKRVSEHIYHSFSKNSLQNKYYFHRAIKKYGVNNFEWSILWASECSNKVLSKLEIYYISIYESINPKKGYNLTSGGQGGDYNTGKKFGEETKQKHRIARLNKSIDKTIYCFFNKETKIIENLTQTEFRLKYNFKNNGNMPRLVSGKRKTYNNWIIK